MNATKYPNCRESFAAWTEFSEREPVKTDSMMLSNALGKIADAALEILQASPSVENKAVFWEWELRNESLLEQSGDVYFLYMSKLFTGTYISLGVRLRSRMEACSHIDFAQLACSTCVQSRQQVAPLSISNTRHGR